MDADVDNMANIKPMLDRTTKIQRQVNGVAAGGRRRCGAARAVVQGIGHRDHDEPALADRRDVALD